MHKLSEWLQLSKESQSLLNQFIKEFSFPEPGPIIHKGQAVSGAYIVLEGELRVFTYSPNGSEATLYALKPGDTCVLTLNCVFNNFRYPAWVEASKASKVALIPGNVYKQLFKTEPQIQNITVKALSTLVFQLMDSLEEAQTLNLEQRLARFLLKHADSDGTVEITQQNLANHMGSTREVVARLIQKLKAQGPSELREQKS